MKSINRLYKLITTIRSMINEVFSNDCKNWKVFRHISTIDDIQEKNIFVYFSGVTCSCMERRQFPNLYELNRLGKYIVISMLIYLIDEIYSSNCFYVTLLLGYEQALASMTSNEWDKNYQTVQHLLFFRLFWSVQGKAGWNSIKQKHWTTYSFLRDQNCISFNLTCSDRTIHVVNLHVCPSVLICFSKIMHSPAQVLGSLGRQLSHGGIVVEPSYAWGYLQTTSHVDLDSFTTLGAYFWAFVRRV